MWIRPVAHVARTSATFEGSVKSASGGKYQNFQPVEIMNSLAIKLDRDRGGTGGSSSSSGNWDSSFTASKTC